MSIEQRKGIPLNDYQRIIIEQIYRKENTVRACIQRILSVLFSAGIQVSDKNQMAKIRKDFEHHLQAHWVPFACETVLNYVLYGFSVHIINKEREKETRRVIRYPTVVPLDKIQIKVDVVFCLIATQFRCRSVMMFSRAAAAF